MLVTVAVIVGLVVVPYVVFRWYAQRVGQAESPVEDRLHRIKRAQQIGGVVLPIGAIVGLVAVDGFGRLVEGVSVGPELFGLNVLTMVLIFAAPAGFVVLPILSMTLGSYPTVRSLRETEASMLQVGKRVLAGLGIILVSVAIAVGSFIGLTAAFDPSTPVLIGFFGALVVGLSGLTPYLTALFQDRVPLTGERRERVEHLCADLGYRPRGLYLLEGESTKTANALVAGTIPGLRYVFLNDYLLAESSDEELQSIIAHEFGHIAGRHLWQRSLLSVAVFGGWIAAVESFGFGGLEEQFGFLGFFLPFMGLFFVYQFGLLGGLTLWQEYRADAYAAREVSTEGMVEALELLAAANDARQDTGLLYSLLTQHPSIADRIENVRQRAGEIDTA